MSEVKEKAKDIQSQLKDLVAESNHVYFSIVSAESTDDAHKFGKKANEVLGRISSQVEIVFLSQTRNVPKTNVTDIVMGELLSKEETCTKHSATCVIEVSIETVETCWIVVFASNRQARKRLDSLGKKEGLDWHEVAEAKRINAEADAKLKEAEDKEEPPKEIKSSSKKPVKKATTKAKKPRAPRKKKQ